MSPQRCVNVLGLGLIGGSIGVGLRERGWLVHGEDQTPERGEDALRRGFIDAVGLNPSADLTVIAAPVLAVPGLVERALATTTGG